MIKKEKSRASKSRTEKYIMYDKDFDYKALRDEYQECIVTVNMAYSTIR